jgi:hypothetical protein
MAEQSPALLLRHRRDLPDGPAAKQGLRQLIAAIGISSSSMLATTAQEVYLSHKSDHVLDLAYNALLNGRCLEDIELRRNGKALLAGLGAQPILTREPAGG